MNEKAQQDFQNVNNVLMGVINIALGYLMTHDVHYKQYCLQLASWEGLEKLEKMLPSLSEPFLTPVRSCLEECKATREKNPEVKVNDEEFPLAAESLTRLAGEMDQILNSDSSLEEGIDDNSLASQAMYVNLAETASQLVEA